jgi:hypothetical protein
LLFPLLDGLGFGTGFPDLQQREEKAQLQVFSFVLGAVAFFALVFLCAPVHFFALCSKARKREKTRVPTFAHIQTIIVLYINSEYIIAWPFFVDERKERKRSAMDLKTN